MNKDIYLKDEGEFITVVFQTERAKKALKTESNEVLNATYGNDLPKLDIPLESKNDIIKWCVTHSLTMEEF